MDDARPNILLLMTDQQRFDTIAAAGYGHMKTPNLDRLVAGGCLFTHAYTPNPICVPARHCTLTGTTEVNHGITGNSMGRARLSGLPTLPGVLADAGYFTAAVGKMHFSPPRNHHGFLEMHLMEEIPGHRADDAYAEYLDEKGQGEVRTLHGARPLIYHEPQRALVPAEDHGCAWVATRTIETIERNAGRRPFFIWSSWIKPHPPWNVPAEWEGHYDDVDLPEPIPGPRPEPAPDAPGAWFGEADAPADARKVRAAYYTTISMVDEAIGRILDHLEARGELDSTMILFTSDHGEMLQDHGHYQKMQPYESSAHIPFIVRYPPAFAPGSREERFVDLLDIMPTALDAAGVDPAGMRSARPWDPAGSSLLKLDEGRDRSVQYCRFAEGAGRWSMVRDRRYKYIHFADGGTEHLYDLEKDPQERRNLVGTPDLPDVRYRDLRAHCLGFEERWGPPGAVVNGAFLTVPAKTDRSDELCGKFPGWANRQIPQIGEGDVDSEARILAKQIQQAIAHHGEDTYIRNHAPGPRWTEHFLEMLTEAGVSPEVRDEVAASLRLR